MNWNDKVNSNLPIHTENFEKHHQSLKDDPILKKIQELQELVSSLCAPPSHLISNWGFRPLEIQKLKNEEYEQIKNIIQTVKSSNKHLQDFRLKNAERLCAQIEESGSVEKWEDRHPYYHSLEFIPKNAEDSASHKLLVHFLGDSFGEGTSLEGEKMISIVSYVSRFLRFLNEEQVAKIFDHPKKVEFLKEALNSAILSSDLIQNPECNYEDQAQKLKEFIEERLSKGLPCVLMGGWTNSEGGHAIYYEILPQKNGKFTWKAYNRGEGVHHHDVPSKSDTKYLYPAFYGVKNIDKSHLLDPLFLRGLIEITNAIKIHGTEKETYYGATDLYERLFKTLKGEEIRVDVKDHLSSQKSGTCSWKSLSAFFASYLAPSEYHRFIFSLKQQVFWDYTHHKFLKGEITSEEFSVYEKASAAYANSLNEAFERKVISEDEYALSIGNLQTLQEQQNEYRREKLKNLSIEAPNALISERSLTLWQKSVDIPPPASSHEAEASTGAVHRKIPEFDVPHLFENSRNIVENISTVAHFCKEALEKKEYDVVVETFRSLMAQLPLPSAEKSSNHFWKILAEDDPDKAVDVVKNLGELHHIFTYSLINSTQGTNGCLDSEVLVDTYTTVAIVDALLLHTDPYFTGMFGIDPLPDYRFLSLFLNKPVRSKYLTPEQMKDDVKRNLTFQIKNPCSRQRLLDIHEYLEKRAENTGAGKKYPFSFEGDTYSEAPNDAYFPEVPLFKEDLETESISPEFTFFSRALDDPHSLNLLVKYAEELSFTEFLEAETRFAKIASLAQFQEGITKVFPIFSLWRNLHAENRHILLAPTKRDRDFSLNEFNLVCRRGLEGNSEDLNDWKTDFFAYLLYYSDLHNIFSKDDNTKFIFSWSDFRCVPTEWRFNSQFREIRSCLLQGVLRTLISVPSISENEVMVSKLDDFISKGYFNKAAKIADDELRELLLLATNKPLQIDRLISYYTLHRESLLDVDHQTFFTLLFHENGVLSDALFKRPELYRKVSKFLQEGYKMARFMGNVNAGVFYLEALSSLDAEFAFLKKKSDQNWLKRAERVEKDSKKFVISYELSDWLSVKTLKKEDRSILSSAFIASLPPSPENIMFPSLLMAMGHLNLFPIASGDQTPERKGKVLRNLARLENKIYKYIEHSPLEALSSLTSSDPLISQLVLQKKWKLEFPWCHSEDGEIDINVKTGLFLRNGKSRIILPEQFAEQLSPEMYPEGTIVEAKGFFQFEYLDLFKNQIKITTDGQSEILQTERISKDGRKLRLITAELLGAELNKLNHIFCWADDKTGECILTRGPEENYESLYKYVQNPNTKEGTLERIPKNINEDVYKLQKVQPGPLSWLTRFVDEGEILLWGTDEGTPRLLEIPNLDLTFIPAKLSSDQNVWMCQQHPGYFMAPVQFSEVLEKIHIQKYLLLENKESAQRVLLPVKKGDHQYCVHLDYKFDSSLHRNQLLGDPEANLRLASLALNSGFIDGYSMAHTLLRPQNVIPITPTSNVLKGFQGFFAIDNKDNHPHAVVCRLQAAYAYELIYEALSLENKRPNNFIQKLAEDLDQYSQDWKKLGAFRLDEQFENRLFALIEKEKMFLQNSSGFFWFERNYAKNLRWYHGNPWSQVRVRNASYNLKKLENGVDLEPLLNDAFEKKDPALTLDPVLYTRPDDHMGTLFLEFLPHAYKQENDPDKKKLRVFLEISKQDPNQNSQTLRAVLEEICDYPQLYPQCESSDPMYVKNIVRKIVHPALRKKIDRLKAVQTKDVIEKVRKSSRREKPRIDTPFITRSSAVLGETCPRAQAMEVDEIFDLDPYLKPYEEEKDSTLIDFIEQRLRKIFPNSKSSLCFEEQELQRLNKDIDAYMKLESEKEPKGWEIKDEAIPEAIHQLELKVAYRHQKEFALQTALLDAVNQGNYGEASMVKQAAMRLGRKQDILSFTDLLILHGRKEHKILSPEKAKELFQAIKEYLDYANETQKYARGLKLLQDHQKTSDEKARLDVKHEAFDTLEAKIAYNPDKHPERQVIEHVLDLVIRPEQIQMFKQLEKSGRGIVMQAIPGFGKTTLIMPLYCLLRADGENLSVCVVPDQLLTWIGDELRNRLGPTFDIWLRKFSMEATSELTSSELSQADNFLEEVRVKAQALIMGDKTAHCLNIQLQKALVRCCKNTGDLKCLDQLLDMVTRFQERSKPIGDEAHIWLNTRREVNTPIGEKCSLPLEEQQALVLLYDILLTDPNLKTLLQYDFSSELNSEANLFTEEVYNKKAKTFLVEALIQRLIIEPFSGTKDSDKIHKFMKELSKEEIHSIRQYFLGDRSPELTKYVDGIALDPASNVIHLLAQEIESLLPSTLKKKCDESYALEKDLGIPARNGLPLVGSEFGNPHETANYTLQAMMKHGVSEDWVRRWTYVLQGEALSEMNENKSLEDIEAYKTFSKISSGNQHLFRLSDSDIREIAENVNKSLSLKGEFILRFILPQIRFYTGKLNSNCYHLARLMPKMRAVTGTLAENYAYPSQYEILSVPGTDSKTFFTLYSHALSLDPEIKEIKEISTISVSEHESPEDLIQVTKERIKAGEQVRLITDAAGYLNDTEINKTARKWVKELKKLDPSLKGTCYHENGKMVVYDSDSKKTLPLNASPFKPEEQLTVLKQPYVTGTDTKQSAKAVSLVTVGVNTTRSLLIQACWRARGIHKQQRVHFVLSKDVENVIRVRLKLGDKEKITLDHIIYFTHQNEIRSQEKDNTAGIKLQMREHVQALIIGLMQECRKKGVSYKNLLIPEVADLFESHTPKEARELYAGTKEKGDPRVILERDVQYLLDKFKKAQDKSSLLRKRIDLKELKQELRGIINLKLLPKEIEAQKFENNLDATQEIEVNKEIELSNEKEQQVEQEVVADELKSKKAYWRRLPWDLSKLEHKEPERSKLFSILGISLFGKKTEENSSFVPVREFMFSSQEKLVRDLANVWDPRLKVSSNIATMRSLGPEDRVAQPFDSMQKQAPFVLVKHHRSKDEWEVCLLDQTDAEFFLEKLNQDREAEVQGDWELLLYDLTLGIVKKGPGNLTEKEIEKNKDVCSLIAQAKFFNGMTHYTERENKRLKKWIDTQDPKKMKSLFEEVITRYKSNRKKFECVRL